MNHAPIIDILMSTYNGSRYLRDQLESIHAQTFQDWRLLVRDDGSSDRTVEIVKEYQTLFGNKLVVFKEVNVGVINSFSTLLSLSSAPYVMFCDQDDVWMTDKLEAMLLEIKNQESVWGRETPILLFSDLILVDNALKPLADSFWRSHGVNPEHINLSRLLLQNIVTGCASIFNRALVDVSSPIQEGAVMHDWWLALHACIYGKLVPISRATVNYRQHGENQVGANTLEISRLFKIIAKPLQLRQRIRRILIDTSVQAKAVLKAAHNNIRLEHRDLLQGYADIAKMSFFKKRIFLLKYNIRFSSFYRNCAFFLFI